MAQCRSELKAAWKLFQHCTTQRRQKIERYLPPRQWADLGACLQHAGQSTSWAARGDCPRARSHLKIARAFAVNVLSPKAARRRKEEFVMQGFRA